MNALFKLRATRRTPYVRCVLFAGVDKDHLQRAGDLLLREDEHNVFVMALQRGFEGLPGNELVVEYDA